MWRILLFSLIPAILAAQDPRELVRRALETDHHNEELSRQYTFLQRQEFRRLDGQGKISSRDVKTYDVTLLQGSPYRRLVAQDDKPLPPKEEAKQQAKLAKSIEDRQKETPEQRDARIADWRRSQEKRRDPLREMPDAFDFRLAGAEKMNGVDAWVVDATPKPGYKPKSRETDMLRKMKFRLWLEKETSQWMRADIEVLDTVSFGWLLFRLSKGSSVSIVQTHVNNEVWMPQTITGRFSGRIALLVGIRAELLMNYSNFKKFSADSRVVSTEAK